MIDFDPTKADEAARIMESTEGTFWQQKYAFMDAVKKLLREAREKKSDHDDLRKRTNQLFESAPQFAYKVGVEEGMSYTYPKPNPLHEIEDLTQNSSIEMWSASSWSSC